LRRDMPCIDLVKNTWWSRGSDLRIDQEMHRAARLLQEYELEVFTGLCSVLPGAHYELMWQRHYLDRTLCEIGKHTGRSTSRTGVLVYHAHCKIREEFARAGEADWDGAIELALKWFYERGMKVDSLEARLAEQKRKDESTALTKKKEEMYDEMIRLLQIAENHERRGAEYRRKADDVRRGLKKL